MDSRAKARTFYSLSLHFALNLKAGRPSRIVIQRTTVNERYKYRAVTKRGCGRQACGLANAPAG